MKKFSNISNVKVSEEPKVEVKQLNEEEMFKAKVMNLMEQLLSVRTYGPVDRYLRAGNIKVAGKEMFLEALMDLLKDKSSKEEKKILESLKISLMCSILFGTSNTELLERLQQKTQLSHFDFEKKPKL